MRHHRTRKSTRRGQALAEFAIVAPLFFLVLFAVIDFGRYVYYVQVLNNAAREGARYAIVHGATRAPAEDGASDDPPEPGHRGGPQLATGVIGLTDPSVLDIERPGRPDLNARVTTG